MSNYDTLYEDDFENDEVTSAAAKSVTDHMASGPTPHLPLPATHRMSSNGGVATATATGYDSVAATKSGAKGVLQRSGCSVASSFSSYQSSSADPLLRSAHELCSSSSHSSTTSSRDHPNPMRPTGSDSSARPAAEAGKGCRSSPTTGGTDAIVLTSDCVRTSTSPANRSPVTPASAYPSAPQTPEQHKVISTGARDVFNKLSVNDEVQVIASVAGKQPRGISPVKTPGATSLAGALTPVTRDVSADRSHSYCGSNVSSSCNKPIHQSNYTSVVVLSDDDDRNHRRTPAEIDAAAAEIDDDEKGNDDNDASATVSPMEATATQRQPLNSSLSDTYSDSFTSPTSSAVAGPSLDSHPHSPSHAAAKSSQTAHASSGHASLLGGVSHVGGATSAAESLPLPQQRQPSSLPRVLSGAVLSVHSIAHSNSRLKNSASAAKPPTPRSQATLSRSSLSAASPKTQVVGEAPAHCTSRQKQRSVTAGKTADAQLFSGVHNQRKRRADSSDDDNDRDKNSHVGDTPHNDVTQKPTASQFPRLRPSQTSTPTSGDASHAKVGVATVEGHPKTSIIAAEVNDEREPDEMTALLARVAHLRDEVAAWDGRVAGQRALEVEAGAGGSGLVAVTSSQRHSADAAGAARRRRPSSDSSRRAESVGQARLAQPDVKGDRRPVNARLAKLRQENKQLEDEYARHGSSAAGMSVQTLVVRADIQLQKVRQQLKVVTAARRALENRDKRAAHTIEEVHRRMPTADELQERQLNEGIYSRTGLLRTVKELKESVQRTRLATKLMEAKCNELDAQVRRKHLSAITPKEYEALCASREANAKTIEKLKTAICVYAAASAQDARHASKALANGGCAGSCGVAHSNRSSRTTSPHKSTATSVQTGAKERERQHAMLESAEFSADSLLQQKKTLIDRKRELQARIKELWDRVQKRDEQIKVNSAAVGFNFSEAVNSAATACAPFYSVGGTRSARLTPATTSPLASKDAGSPAAGSGAAAARKRSLRDVLRSPVKRRSEATTTSAALAGAVAPARQREQDNAKGTASASHGGPQSSLPALAQRGRRTLPAERQPSSSAVTAPGESSVKRSTQMGSSSAGAYETPLSPAAAGKNAPRSSLPTLSRDAIEAEVAARGSIDATWRKTDASGRRLGQGVSTQKRSKEAAPPALLQSPDGEDWAKAVNSVHGESSVFEEEPVPDEVDETDCGDGTLRAGQRGHATGTAVGPRGACDEVPEEKRGVGKSDKSGRSTPEWLQDD